MFEKLQNFEHNYKQIYETLELAAKNANYFPYTLVYFSSNCTVGITYIHYTIVYI